jgi:hypothetical protein
VNRNNWSYLIVAWILSLALSYGAGWMSKPEKKLEISNTSNQQNSNLDQAKNSDEKNEKEHAKKIEYYKNGKIKSIEDVLKESSQKHYAETLKASYESKFNEFKLNYEKNSTITDLWTLVPKYEIEQAAWGIDQGSWQGRVGNTPAFLGVGFRTSNGGAILFPFTYGSTK